MKSIVIAALMLVGAAAMAIPTEPPPNQLNNAPPYTGPECTQDQVIQNNNPRGSTGPSLTYMTCVNGVLVDLYNTNPPAQVPEYDGCPKGAKTVGWVSGPRTGRGEVQQIPVTLVCDGWNWVRYTHRHH